MFHLPQNHLLSRDRTGQINRSHETRRSDRDHENIYGDHGTQFGALTQTADMEEEDGSGVSSPPLWKTSPETEASSPLHHSYPNLSPKSRLQEIARGRQELMEMVHHMPESSYELSLRDIVEQPKVVEERKKWNFESDMENKKKNKKKGQILRSESNDNGTFLLKMFFPTSLGSKGKKVSPKPPLFEVSEKSFDKEFCKKSFPVAGQSEKGGASSSSSSGSSNNSRSSRHMGGLLPGCWSFFFHAKKSKTVR